MYVTAFLLRTAAIVSMTMFSSKQTVDDISPSAFGREGTSGQMSKVHVRMTSISERRSQACL